MIDVRGGSDASGLYISLAYDPRGLFAHGLSMALRTSARCRQQNAKSSHTKERRNYPPQKLRPCAKWARWIQSLRTVKMSPTTTSSQATGDESTRAAAAKSSPYSQQPGQKSSPKHERSKRNRWQQCLPAIERGEQPLIFRPAKTEANLIASHHPSPPTRTQSTLWTRLMPSSKK